MDFFGILSIIFYLAILFAILYGIWVLVCYFKTKKWGGERGELEPWKTCPFWEKKFWE